MVTQASNLSSWDRGRQISWVRGQLDLHSEFQHSQGDGQIKSGRRPGTTHTTLRQPWPSDLERHEWRTMNKATETEKGKGRDSSGVVVSLKGTDTFYDYVFILAQVWGTGLLQVVHSSGQGCASRSSRGVILPAADSFCDWVTILGAVQRVYEC